MVDKTSPNDANPLASLDEWEDDLKRRYPEPEPEPVPEGVVHATGTKKAPKEFRNHRESARPSVREFYRLNHRYQTLDFVRQKRDEYFALKNREMSIWEALEFLNTLVDDSDPDTDFSQIEHCLQTAEAIRRDGHPRWFILAGLIHDLGKILCLFGEPQWAVVGDTSRSAAGTRKKSSSPSSLTIIPIGTWPSTRRRWEFIPTDAAWTT